MKDSCDDHWVTSERVEPTRSNVTGYSGNVDATAFAPAKFVVLDRPTKNSRPEDRQALEASDEHRGDEPVKRTSLPSIVAKASSISTVASPSRLSIVRMIST